MGKLKIASPMKSMLPQPNVKGDQRDIIDQNPHETEPHSRSKDTLPIHFYEGEDVGSNYIGLVDDIAGNVLSSPMNGQRRSATGEYESPRSVTSVRLKGEK